jgi:hypothetical protein
MANLIETAGGKCDKCGHHQEYHKTQQCSFENCNCGA